MILGISGKAGSGKDAAAAVLVREYGFVRVALADELKRVAKRLFGWDDERLWGPSERRNEPDPEWDGLTARRALQVLGTEVGRALHPDVWIRATMREIATRQRTVGVSHFVVPDVRFKNEVEAIREEGGLVLRVLRPGAGLVGDAGEHASETDLGDSDGMYDARILNDGALAEFEEKIAAFGAILLGKAPPGPLTLG